MALAVRNAARRDEEQNRLAHQYFTMARALIGSAAARGSPPDEYDPLPLMRLHIEILSELESMAARAQVLGSRWRELAEEWSISLSGPFDTNDVPGRLRAQDRFTQCVDSDARSRLDQAQMLLKARAAGKQDEDVRLDPPAPVHYHRDLKLTARAMECSRLAMRVLRGK